MMISKKKRQSSVHILHIELSHSIPCIHYGWALLGDPHHHPNNEDKVVLLGIVKAIQSLFFVFTYSGKLIITL